MDVFSLAAKITLDTNEYETALGDASTKTHSFGEKLKSGLVTAAKVGAAGLAAATTAVTALSKAALDSYGDYEQLTGGVETLFKNSAGVVMEYANNAYQTAGLSANQYMETVTSFSASLLQSLGGDTQAAAEYADMAIRDMSDNANKMGTDMEMIQNAYRGFSRANFTMLDNLALGYGGTKEEMERLLSDAEKLSGVKYDISSYSDMIEAIHVVQTEMGITGTTAAEASSTIQGSVSAAKSAWANLVTGLGDENANLDQLVSNLVTSVETAAGNILPRVTQILSGMGTAIAQLAPVIAAEVPNLITSVLPSLISGGAQLLTGLITGLISAAPSLISAVPGIVSSVAAAISENLPTILQSGRELLDMLTTGILEGIPAMLEKLPDIITNLYNFLAENLPGITEKGFDILISLVDGIIEAIPGMVAKLPEVISAILNYITSELPVILKKGAELLGHLIMGILGAIPEIALQLPAVISAIVDALKVGWNLIKDAGKYLLEGLWAGISDKVEWLKGKVSGVVDTIKGWFTGKKGFDEHSPSKWAAEVGAMVSEGLANGIDKESGKVKKSAEQIAKDTYSTLEEWADRQTKYLKLSYGEQVELWDTIQGQFVQGSKQWSDAEEKIFDLREKTLDEYQKNLTSRTNEILNWYSLFDEVPEKVKVSGDDLLNNLQNQVDGISDFFDKVSALAERDGVGQSLVEEIKEMGPKAMDELDALLALSDEKLSEYAKLFEQKTNLAGQYAAMDLGGGFSTANVDFASSAVGQSSAAIIHSVGGGENGNMPVIPLTINLLTGSGDKFATWLLPDLIRAANAAGTPIASSQYA